MDFLVICCYGVSDSTELTIPLSPQICSIKRMNHLEQNLGYFIVFTSLLSLSYISLCIIIFIKLHLKNI